MRRFLRENGLTLVQLGLFLLFIVGHAVAGHLATNEERRDHRQAPLSFVGFVRSGEFLETVAENWESEFLQMAAFVLLSRWLFQKGSSESKDPEEEESPEDQVPAPGEAAPEAPWPVRRGGVLRVVYQHSLAITLIGLFVGSFVLHVYGGMRAHNEEQLTHGRAPISWVAFLTSARFWYQSLQNWQSEFLAVGLLVLLTVFLRQRGSPQSKPVAAPHGETAG